MPELRSSALSRKSTWPFQPYSVSSCRRISTRLARVLARRALVLEQRGLGHVEHEPNRILGDDRRQHRRVGGSRCCRARDAGTTRGPRVGAVTRVNDRFKSAVWSDGLGRRDVRRCAELRRLRTSASAVADELVAASACARFSSASAFASCARAPAASAFACARSAEYGRGSMTNSRSPFLHHLPIFEVHGLDRARDSRPHLDRVHRLEAAGVVVPVRHALRTAVSRPRPTAAPRAAAPACCTTRRTVRRGRRSAAAGGIVLIVIVLYRRAVGCGGRARGWRTEREQYQPGRESVLGRTGRFGAGRVGWRASR